MNTTQASIDLFNCFIDEMGITDEWERKITLRAMISRLENKGELV